ncbi:polymer-forming cytoskeletal protein [Laceyella putida]|uniref:Polymer-forming cytoskeletal protein n=1 Tax=Laceyella putida TaxID=110101 RepID=A0ABW2RPC4_9BACL
MDKEKRRDLTISGSGSAAGGLYDRLSINGEGRIHGDVDCISIKAYGVTTFAGNVKAERFDIAGETTIKGKVEVEEMKVKGQAHVYGYVICEELKVMGATTIEGNLTSEEIEIKGATTIKGDCEAEDFQARGGFTIDGLLNAGHIHVRLYGKCQAKEIGGETIRIEKDGLDFSLFKWLKSILHYTNELVADTIEGDDIYLENTKAKVVRGNNVIIGSGCQIDLVEYKDQFEQKEDTVVKEHKKV